MATSAMNPDLCAVLGAFVGDAAGATLEFFGSAPIGEEDVRAAMAMPGGGSLSVAAGQLTDDSELALALMSSQVGKVTYDAEAAARAYADWYASDPFDVGNTCGRAFASVMFQERKNRHAGLADWKVKECAPLMKLTSATHNMESRANGALMRATPIPVMFPHCSLKEIAEFAREDAGLSHPSPSCKDANAVYCVAIACLLRGYDVERTLGTCAVMAATPEVHEWLEDSRGDLPKRCTPNIGWVRWGFTLAFHFLRRQTPYEEAIRETLKRGGDTDTNAAIVGGLLGALHGLEAIPEYMLKPVLAFDPSTHDPQRNLLGHRRPALYRAANALEWVAA